MPSLNERIDAGTITVTFLPLPKGKKRGAGVGFCAHDPVASLETTGGSPPFRWMNGKAEACTFNDLKKLGVSQARGSSIAGSWYNPKGEERGLLWTRQADGSLDVADLHPRGWDRSFCRAAADGQQVGHGYHTFAKEPTRALLWSGSADSMVVLTGPDPERDAYALGVSGGVQAGYVGAGPGQHRACLWRGTSESFVTLHPPGDVMGSELSDIADGRQCGVVWGDDMMQHAAAWTGTPDSFVDLHPRGFKKSRANATARGFQVGWVAKKEMGMLVQAALWNGTANEFLDLQQFLPEPWNATSAYSLDVFGDTLRVIGQAQQAVQQGGYEMDAGTVPVIWEIKLRIPEPEREEAAPSAGAKKAKAAPAELTGEQRVERAVDAFARAVIAEDYAAAHQLLAPWLRKQVTAKRLGEILTGQRIDDVKPADFVSVGNDSSLDQLRSWYAEYYKDDRGRTLGSISESGDWGPPSLRIADEITADNFRQWLNVDFTPDPDDQSGLDYCLRVYVIVADVDGTPMIAHLEPGD